MGLQWSHNFRCLIITQAWLVPCKFYLFILVLLGVLPVGYGWILHYRVHAEGVSTFTGRRSFGSVLDIIPLADSVTKLTARCEICGKRACFTLRKTQDKQIELIGGVDVYMPVCRQHYASGQVAMEATRHVLESKKVECGSHTWIGPHFLAGCLPACLVFIHGCPISIYWKKLVDYFSSKHVNVDQIAQRRDEGQGGVYNALLPNSNFKMKPLMYVVFRLWGWCSLGLYKCGLINLKITIYSCCTTWVISTTLLSLLSQFQSSRVQHRCFYYTCECEGNPNWLDTSIWLSRSTEVQNFRVGLVNSSLFFLFWESVNT